MSRRDIKKVKRAVRKINRILTMVATLLIIIAVCSLGTMKVNAQRQQKMTKASYKEFEDNYKINLRAYLNKNGFTNAGVTLTNVTEADGSRSYTLIIHHKSLMGLTDEELDTLTADLTQMAGVKLDREMDVTVSENNEISCRLVVSQFV